MDIILGKVICLVVDLVNTYISLVLGTGSGRSPFLVIGWKVKNRSKRSTFLHFNDYKGGRVW
jgi:hypothetical protein